ncbi:mitogen-activated protein kinase 15 isoform X3 [Marmota flaviventris]
MLLREFGDHPNIIRLLDVIPAENDRDIYLVFEFMDTDLNAVIRKGSVLEDTHKRFIFYQLLQATRFLHSGHVIHRDQKPSNVLLDATCRVKLCDFGLARSLSNLPEGPEGGALTEYVATRWYRAPEVLLSSPWYTLGVDMWSLGCILGEMLRGQPLFPGTSTVHQLQLILETVPPPPEEDLRALGAGYSCTLLHLLGSRPRQSLDDILPPDTPRDALDLLRKLLVFAPSKRLSAAQALQHPYVRRFHGPSREWTRETEVWLPVLERDQLSASEYRSRLYQMILERRGHSRGPREGILGSTALGPEARASWAQGHLFHHRAIPQIASGMPVRNPGSRPQSSPDGDPEQEASGATRNIPRPSSAPQPQPLPPGRWERSPRTKAEPPCTPPGISSLRGMAPSLTLQAAAQATNQALIRRDWPLNGGLRAAGGRQVSLAVSPRSLCAHSRPFRLIMTLPVCRSHPGPPGRFRNPGQAAGCLAPQPGRGRRELPGLSLGATPRLMGQCAVQRWTACP